MVICLKIKLGACFGSTYTKIVTIQRLAWPLHKDDMQIREAFHIFMTLRGGVGNKVGGGFRMGYTCTPMDDSCQCMAKTTTIL